MHNGKPSCKKQSQDQFFKSIHSPTSSMLLAFLGLSLKKKHHLMYIFIYMTALPFCDSL